MGAKVTICGPPNLVPKFTDGLNIKVNHSVDDIDWANAIIVSEFRKSEWDKVLFRPLESIDQCLGLQKNA